MPSCVFSKTKQKLNRQCRKTAGVLHRRTEKNTTNANNTAGFTTPPLDFSQEDLSVTTTEAFESAQSIAVVESTTPTCPDILGSSELVHERTAIDIAPTIPYSASVSFEPITPQNGPQADSSTGSVSSLETALTVYSAATATKPEDQLIVRASGMADKQKKASRHKVLEALNKLKIPFWPWKAPTQKAAAQAVEQKDCTDRCQWDIIEKIEPDTILQILRSALVELDDGYAVKPMRIVKIARGSYHKVYIVKTFNPRSQMMEGWFVKIPGHGTPDRWTADDEYMLKQEYETMRLLITYTEVPAPFPIDYSATLETQYGVPYIIKKELAGKNACELWYDDWCTTPSPETEQKRENMLRSLAAHMTELNKLRFAQIGMPVFDPTAENFENYDDIERERLPVEKYYVWPFCDTYQSVERGPSASTQAFVQDGIKESNEIEGFEPPGDPAPGEDRPMMTEDDQKVLGTAKFFDIVTFHPVFQSTASDTFSLRHSDLDLQNILIDDDGNVTGILDWDGSLAMPRCVAHAAVPHFLELDWYGDAALHTPFLPWRAGHYRSIYAAALLDARNPDVQFTSKSHMYQAVFAALYEGGNKQDVMSRLLKEIPGLQIDDWEVKYLLAKGCKMTEDMLKKELGKVLEPKMSPEYFRGETEKQQEHTAAEGWMDDFEGFSSTHGDDHF
ncbi:hypothetical protein E8E12_002473 [Didymella heteroderae]|uniref:Aminoglycoside phosphotransferase domain-containing protein n=1 Tax=Didymella heteroderae TaxID=1769908 RepID=A0A9P5BVH0_9PLEO|nr:hypothetical protein E8E12_002473 [Didymella heteroderae]